MGQSCVGIQVTKDGIASATYHGTADAPPHCFSPYFVWYQGGVNNLVGQLTSSAPPALRFVRRVARFRTITYFGALSIAASLVELSGAARNGLTFPSQGSIPALVSTRTACPRAVLGSSRRSP